MGWFQHVPGPEQFFQGVENCAENVAVMVPIPCASPRKPSTKNIFQQVVNRWICIGWGPWIYFSMWGLMQGGVFWGLHLICHPYCATLWDNECEGLGLTCCPLFQFLKKQRLGEWGGGSSTPLVKLVICQSRDCWFFTVVKIRLRFGNSCRKRTIL